MKKIRICDIMKISKERYETMDWILASLLILLIIFLPFFFKEKKKYKQKLQEVERIEQERQQIISVLKDKEEKLGAIQELNKIVQSKENDVKNLDSQIREKENFNSTLFRIREEEVERLIEESKKERIAQLEKDIEEWGRSAQQAKSYDIQSTYAKYWAQVDEARKELDILKDEVEDYRIKRESINREILRQRAIEEKQEFYTIQIEDSARHDMEVINSIRPQIYKFETLNKLIYDNYISRPAKEMVKRVLEGRNPSGIYKVTNTATGEIYIGKSTSVGDRWINHIKSACGLEGVADSQFQRALRQYGVTSFTWELLEEVPKDQLTEKEKYYISFYDTTHYGYNMRKG